MLEALQRAATLQANNAGIMRAAHVTEDHVGPVTKDQHKAMIDAQLACLGDALSRQR